MKIKSVLILTSIVGGLLLLKYLFFPSPSFTNNSQKQVNPGASGVNAFIVRSEKLENIVYASGTIVANEEVELKPEISGKIIALPLQEGAIVTKNQLLLKINDLDFQIQLKKLLLENELASVQLKRQQELLSINGISKEEFELAQNKVNSIKADIEYLQSQIAKTEIRAPFNGMIGLKKVSDGSYIAVGTSIANVLQIDPVKIDFSVSERYAPYIHKGVKVLFNVEGINKEFEGEVYAVEPKIDINTRTIQIRAICPNKNAEIFPGAFARMQILLKDINDAIMIPTEAVIPELRGKKVYLIKNGKAQPTMIETGVRTSSKIQVLDGLNVGDTLVTTGFMQLKPDAPVKVLQLK